MPYVPDYRTATAEEDATFVPQSGFAEYLGAKVVDEAVETTMGADRLRFEATRAEIQAYPDLAQELVDADVSRYDFHLPWNDPRKEAREAIIGLPRMSQEDWKNSPYFRPGMKYEPDITEARLRVYSEWYDARARRQDVIERRDAGFFDGTFGFLAGIAGAAIDPVNLISVAVAPEASLGVKIAAGAAENIGAELLTQLTTMDIRSEAGISPTVGERMLNVAFAGIIGSAFGAGSHLFHMRKMKKSELVRNDAGNPISVRVVESRPNVTILTDKTIDTLTIRQKRDILARLDEGMVELGRGPHMPEMDPHSSDFGSDPGTIEPFQKVVSDALTGDADVVTAVLDAIDLNDASVREAVMPDKPTVDMPDPDTLARDAADIDMMAEMERNAVGEDQNISLEDIDTPPDNQLLQGNTLFEVADRESDNFESGIAKAVDLINSDGCR
jgi:hypothetical protein